MVRFLDPCQHRTTCTLSQVTPPISQQLSSLSLFFPPVISSPTSRFFNPVLLGHDGATCQDFLKDDAAIGTLRRPMRHGPSPSSFQRYKPFHAAQTTRRVALSPLLGFPGKQGIYIETFNGNIISLPTCRSRYQQCCIPPHLHLRRQSGCAEQGPELRCTLI
ncbi:hypothetical protein LZ31DRAFT_260674 [Colletotrichum somersetense]|nr:hypothetical protein LZ31DRAFT_260674 [Colletotrichum somersetense]